MTAATARKTARPVTRVDVYEHVNTLVLASLEQGVVPWQMPWTASSAGGFARSMSTGRPYRGINTMLLALAALETGYTEPWWGTYRQIVDERGGNLKGQHGTFVVFWKRYTRDDVDDAGDTTTASVVVAKHFYLFNVAQAVWPEGSRRPEAAATDTRLEPERQAAAEGILDGYCGGRGPAVEYGWPQAAYVPARDRLLLPARADFRSSNGFYSTAFHEAGHSTGHPSRLDRKGAHVHAAFGDGVYAREELVAEFAAAFLMGVAGLDLAGRDGVAASAAYIGGWRQRIAEEPRLLVTAAAAGQKAADYVLGVQPGGGDDETGGAS